MFELNFMFLFFALLFNVLLCLSELIHQHFHLSFIVSILTLFVVILLLKAHLHFLLDLLIQVLRTLRHLLHLLEILLLLFMHSLYPLLVLLLAFLFEAHESLQLSLAAELGLRDHPEDLLLVLEAGFTQLVVVLFQVDVYRTDGFQFLLGLYLLYFLALPFKLLFSAFEFFQSLPFEHLMLLTLSSHVLVRPLFQSLLLFLLVFLQQDVLVLGLLGLGFVLDFATEFSLQGFLVALLNVLDFLQVLPLLHHFGLFEVHDGLCSMLFGFMVFLKLFLFKTPLIFEGKPQALRRI